MVGGQLCCFFTYSFVLLFGVCLLDVEASSCERIIHKKVGDTVVLSSCLPTVGITLAYWQHKNQRVAEKDTNVTTHHQLKGRVSLNLTDFSLTVRRLTLQDSGDFSFVSEVNDQQRKTIIITLQVHESITKEPDLTSNSTWDPLNKSCTVWLQCSSASDTSVTYNWTFRNQTHSGSRLQYIIRPEDGETSFTCTVSDFFSKKRASKTVTCSNRSKSLVFLLSIAGGSLLIVIVFGIVVAVCFKKRHVDSVPEEPTVYAEVTDITAQDPCSFYETINNRVGSLPRQITAGPQTVYDKIQLSRVRKASASPYQDIS
ncbi:SLAM family member 9 isoform X2 [Mastacembelus armatus]|uniref:SLAM family member 9 isoform X2 n=1 Tax=Mastacembelus armatus TaxID=205130 RepID=UPI000E45E2AA|nr:signaling lymphocytic activation molecule isoform X2 [Mastacembelus armatus]